MVARFMVADDQQLDKVELLAMLLDVLQASELEWTSAEAEYEYIHALDLTADVLNRFAEAKRHALEGLPATYPQDLLRQHTQMLRTKNRHSKKAA